MISKLLSTDKNGMRGLILSGLVKQLGITSEVQLVRVLGELGLPKTREEDRELAALAQMGPMRTKIYRRWSAAIVAAESRT